MFNQVFVRPEQDLINAATDGDLRGIDAVIRQGVNVNHQNEHGNSTLLLASERGNLNIVKALLNYSGINVNLQNSEGNTAIMSAIINGYLNIVEELLRHKDINVTLSNTAGNTALTLAKANGHMAIVRCLRDFDNTNVAGNQNRAVSEMMEQNLSNMSDQNNYGNEHLTSIDDIIMQSREKLRLAMTDSSSDPMDIAQEYVDHCINDKVLGEGAFGTVYLANDDKLPKKFVIKKIKFTNGDGESIRNICKTFKTEISVSHVWHIMKIDLYQNMSELNCNTSINSGFKEISPS